MILSQFFDAIRRPQATAQVAYYPEVISSSGYTTTSGQTVNQETSQQVATVFRCGNIISDDIAKMPLQLFVKLPKGRIERVQPNGLTRNLSYLVEIKPNRWQIPFVWKKTLIKWLLYWGNGYIWQPPRMRELFILPSSRTWPDYNENGDLIYRYFPALPETKAEPSREIPAVEVLHLLINSQDGITGRGVIEFARESIGDQLGAYEVRGQLFAQGLATNGIIWAAGDLNQDARDKVRTSYMNAITGSGNAGGVAVFDSKIAKFEPVTMKLVDAQFLEQINATDADIANFFGMPLYKLNQGKQSYQSNEQQNLDYLKTTLDPYLVQFEQAAADKWLTVAEQSNMYFRFVRDALLRTDAATRGDYLQQKVLSGQLTPNEARNIDDMSAYDGGDNYYMPVNVQAVTPAGGE